jgi:hypothetical protein
MTDDQGYGDLGFHGNPVIRTPVMDSLARNSARFTQFYVSPVCAPTRSSLMTGRYSIRTGVYDTYNGGAIMSDEEITIAEYLKTAGYFTAFSGNGILEIPIPSGRLTRDLMFHWSMRLEESASREIFMKIISRAIPVILIPF